ncbi:MAG: NUDIX domain-containing protein [Candidatus Woesearchaeota archaeon]
MIHVVGGFIVKNGKVLMLFQKIGKHWESVGGKVEADSCKNPEEPTLEELQHNLEREIHEEIGTDITVKEMYYLGKKLFRNHHNNEFIMHKFVVFSSGEPVVNEPEMFEKLEWIPIVKMETYNISNGSKPFISLLKEFLVKLNNN